MEYTAYVNTIYIKTLGRLHSCSRDRRTTRGSGRPGFAQQPVGLPWKMQDTFLCQKFAEQEGKVSERRENVSIDTAGQERNGEEGSFS